MNEAAAVDWQALSGDLIIVYMWSKMLYFDIIKIIIYVCMYINKKIDIIIFLS